MDVIHYLGKGDAPRLAYRHRPGRGPAVVFLPGYMSDMEGGKATALDAWAGSQGLNMLGFDLRRLRVERRRVRRGRRCRDGAAMCWR